MQIIELGAGYWTVYAVCTDDTTCGVLEFVSTLDTKRRNKVLADLQKFVPDSTPQDWVRMDFSWQLRNSNSILEFRWPQKGGGTPRVYWFYDDKRVIVCSHGVNKKGDTDPEDIRIAERTRDEYLKAKKSRNLTVVEYRNFVSLDSDDDIV
jgi:hypothetical protein